MDHPSRWLLATAAVGLPIGPGRDANETGIGRQCDKVHLNASFGNDTLAQAWYHINCISTFTVDSQIFITMWTTTAVGALCLAVFCWGQSFVSVYRGRLLSPSVAIKPPVPSNRNFFTKYFAWFWITVTMSENELLATAGMDALMMERLIIFCLQFMFPVMVIAVSTLIPIHMNSKFSAGSSAAGQAFAKSNLMTLTMGNLEPEAKTLWVHFTFVILFTAYGMWLLDQHYKSYVLLRQQYLTRGDSVSHWLGPKHTPRQKALASYSSMMIDHNTQQDLYNPLWTFARAKASDADTDVTPPPSAAASGPAPVPPAPAPPAAAADAGAGGTGLARQHSAVLTSLASIRRCSSPPTCPQQSGQQQHRQQLLQSARESGDWAALDSAYQSCTSMPARAAASLFACAEEQGLLQERSTLQMVQLSDIIFPVQSEGAPLDGEQSTVGLLPRQHSAQAQQDRSGAASPSEGSSAAGSQLASRQSSGRALLAGKHTDSTAPGLQQAQAEQQGAKPFSFLRGHSKGRTQHAHAEQQPAAAAAAAAGEPTDLLLESADGAVPNGATGKARRRFSGCAPGGCTWRRLSGRSTDSDGPAVSFAPLQAEAAAAKEGQRRAAVKAAARAAAARAAAQLGADVEWWQHKTGDLLLDRHVVQVDLAKDFDDADAGDPADRPFYWWELAPAEGLSTAGGVAAASSSGAGRLSAGGAAAGSNLQPVPGTALLFDRRSLRARRPSVRFRNTVHVRGKDGGLVPLHVSTYAVLVTDVPDVPGLHRSALSRSTSSSSCGSNYEFRPGGTLCGPFAEACSSLVNALDHALQFVCWGWPCLLSRADLREHTKAWIQLSFKSTQSMVSTPSAEDRLEAGELLQDGDDSSAAHKASPPQQQRGTQPSLRQRVGALSAARSLRQPVTRQELVELTFTQLFPEDVQAVLPAQEYKAVNELLREWNRKLQVYIHTEALCDLKRQKQQRKKAAEARQQAAAAAAGSAGGGQQQQQQLDAEVSTQQVCIEVTTMQHKVAAKEAAAAASLAGAGAGSCMLGSIAEVAIPTNRDSSSSSAPGNGSSTAAAAAAAAPQQPAMARPARHSRHSSTCSTDCDLSDDDEELGCCAATARRLCCCACCGVGAIQDGGHGLLPPPGDVGMQDDRAGWARCGRCCGLFRRRGGGVQDQQELPKGSKDNLAEKRRELLELEAKIIEEQKKVLEGPDTGNFIVLFKTPQAASLAAHSTVYPDSGADSQGEPFKVQPAPSPEDVLWPSLWASPADRRSVLGIVTFWYSILYLVPTGFFAASLNVINLTVCSHASVAGRSFDWFCQSKFLQFLVTIVAPYILLIVWQNAVIPAYMYRLELRRAVAVSLSEMERRILLVYCGWELINLFLGGVLSGSLVSQVQVFFEHPEQWAQVLGAAIPQTSNFFLTYVISRAFMLNLVRLLMPHGGMWRWIGQMLFTGFTSFRHAATASYRACIIYPASIRYGREPGLVLLILLIGMAYCVAAPLITVFVFAYMVTAYIVWRYQIIYVCVRAYESGGKMWPTYFLCIEWCLGFFVAFTSSMLIFKKANMQGVLVLMMMPALYLFNRRCRHKYCSKVDHPPLWLAHTAPRSEIDPLVYMPPCLQPNAQGWFFEAGKPWIRWGVPAYNNPKKPGHDAGTCFC